MFYLNIVELKVIYVNLYSDIYSYVLSEHSGIKRLDFYIFSLSLYYVLSEHSGIKS